MRTTTATTTTTTRSTTMTRSTTTARMEEDEPASIGANRILGEPSSPLPKKRWVVVVGQVLAIVLYLASWVANAEALQGICNGSFLPQHDKPNGDDYDSDDASAPVTYNKPVFLTWLDYNLMILGFLFVWPWIRRRQQQHEQQHAESTISFWQYFTTVWIGQRSLSYMLAACTALSFLLTAAHVFYVIALPLISVATLNAAYQMQAVCTLVLSVRLLGGTSGGGDGSSRIHTFSSAQWTGIAISCIGVAMIVLPPLWSSSSNSSTSSVNVFDTWMGILATLASALLWGFYQVAWRALLEGKLKPGQAAQLTPTEELVDTLFTLAVIGAANLMVGWILLPVADWEGLERFEWPEASWTTVLTINAVIEYAFNAFIAIAIHWTSPIATSLTAPLTIPLSWLADQWLYQIPVSTATTGGWGWIGALFILLGVYLLEFQPTSSSTSSSLFSTGAFPPWFTKNTPSRPESSTLLPPLRAENHNIHDRHRTNYVSTAANDPEERYMVLD